MPVGLLCPSVCGPIPGASRPLAAGTRSGALDSDLLAQRTFYGTNFSKPLLFINDGGYFASKAQAMGLTGSQCGVMNETGSYPGQPWLWLWPNQPRMPPRPKRRRPEGPLLERSHRPRRCSRPGRGADGHSGGARAGGPGRPGQTRRWWT
jgi:hypothetical protein